jgi:choline dehydrogenase
MSTCNQQEFDYVIVGSGPSAIGLLYGILERYGSLGSTELPFSIAVVERGGKEHHSFTKNPNQWITVNSFNSSSVSLMQTTIGARWIDIPTGRGLGGSTNNNACLVLPPSKTDFETWPTPWKENMMSSIKVIQDALVNNEAILNFRTTVTPMLNIDTTEIVDEDFQETVFPSFLTSIPMSVRRTSEGQYKRINYYDALLVPAFKRYSQLSSRIEWLCNMEVQRLMISGTQVYGVECETTHSDDLIRIKAHRAVILCAGALESPALLLVSGIGLVDDLLDINIPTQGVNLPVGRNLRDHVLFPRVFFHPYTSYEHSPSSIQALYNTQEGENRFQILLTGSAAYPSLAAMAVATSLRRKFELPDGFVASLANFLCHTIFRLIRFTVQVSIDFTPLFYIFRYFCFVTVVALLNPKSSGRIRLKRKNAKVGKCLRKDFSLEINDVYFSDARDVEAFRLSWQRIGQLCAGWFDRGFEVGPPASWLCPGYREVFHSYAHEMCLPYYHWCGTCALGEVVDQELRVKGVKGLLVCDASIMPSMVSSPTALTCAGLGYNLSDIIFRSHPLKMHSIVLNR